MKFKLIDCIRTDRLTSSLAALQPLHTDAQRSALQRKVARQAYRAGAPRSWRADRKLHLQQLGGVK